MQDDTGPNMFCNVIVFPGSSPGKFCIQEEEDQIATFIHVQGGVMDLEGSSLLLYPSIYKNVQRKSG